MTDRGNAMQRAPQRHVTEARVSETRVAEIISRATLVPQDLLIPEARPDELGIDSLGLVEAIFALEEAFDIKVPMGAHRAAMGLDTSSIGAITAGVQALVAARRAA